MSKKPSTDHSAASKTASRDPIWSVRVAAAEIPENGLQMDIAPDAVVREALAKSAGLMALPRLEASFDLTPQGSDGLHVAGRVSASIVQSCVVTLDPLESEIAEEIDLLFMPPVGAAKEEDVSAQAGREVEIRDEPEVLDDGAVDLGELAIEFFLLGIDPYPRKPGVLFETPQDDDPSARPFAALAALKARIKDKDE
jgi:uncharacterized metal-binding protein YceD (DUF177 family)